MNATFIDNGSALRQRLFAHAWYNRVRHETAHGGAEFSVGNVHMIGSDSQQMSMQTLLEAILAANGEGSLERILTVHHGTPDGMYIPLLPGGSVRNCSASRENLALLSRRYHLGESGSAHPITATSGNQPASDDDLASHWSVTSQQVVELRRLMTQVQSLDIQHLDIRACNIGNNTSTLTEIGHFFGIPNVCAPDEYDVFGRLPIQIVSTGPTGRQWVPYVDQRNVIQVWINYNSSTGSATGRTVNQSNAATFLGLFAANNAYRPSPADVQQAVTRQGTEFHALEVDALAVAGSTYQNGLAFPAMSEYAGHLILQQVP
jgi:hypothetical protein